jgi:BirA family biotin operon repressor/biotin-[acetyl-CoA-carboxylase] ligase
MLFRPNLAIADAHVVPTIVGLGAQRSIATLTGVTPELKWPNDLLVGDKKVAGLLGEIVTLDAKYALVVGIGVNLMWSEGFPRADADPELDGLADRATTLFEVSGHQVERDELAELMLVEIERDYLQLFNGNAPAGMAISEVMDRYRAACTTIGRRVRVETALETYEADAIDVDDHGQLVVRREGSIRELDAGDVIHLRTTSA